MRAVDAAGYTMTVEAGLTLAEAQAAADGVNRLFPLSLPSEGSCQIGGNIAINAGGTSVLAYGNARQLVLGLEVVLADGRVWDGLKGLKKDNSGYDLKDLFIGSEGTLGVITAAVLKLFPRPAEKATAFVALPDLASALSLFSLAQETAGHGLTAYEVMAGIVLDLVLKHTPGTRDPFAARHPWYVLMETSGLKADGAAERVLTEVLTRCQRARARRRRGDRRLAGAGARLLAPARSPIRRRRSPRAATSRTTSPWPWPASPNSSPAPTQRLRACARARGPCRWRISATAACTTTSPSRRAWRRRRSWRGGTTSRTPCRTSSSSSAARSRPSTASA